MLALLVPNASNDDESRADCPFCRLQEESYRQKSLIRLGDCKIHANRAPYNTFRRYKSNAGLANDELTS